MNIQKMKAIFLHKMAFIRVSKDLGYNNILNILFHDVDKMFLLLVGMKPKTVSRLHRSYSRHHMQDGNIRDKDHTVIDWECARFTKADKQLTARETWVKYYSHVDMEKHLRKFGL